MKPCIIIVNLKLNYVQVLLMQIGNSLETKIICMKENKPFFII